MRFAQKAKRRWGAQRLPGNSGVEFFLDGTRFPGQMISKNYWPSFRPSVAVLFSVFGRLRKTFQKVYWNRQAVMSTSNENQLPPTLLDARQLPELGRLLAFCRKLLKELFRATLQTDITQRNTVNITVRVQIVFR